MRKVFIPLILLASAQMGIFAQEGEIKTIPDNALLITMVARVLEQNNLVVWDSSSSKVSIPGRAVRVKLTGENILIVTHLTPYQKDSLSYILIAQAEVWIKSVNPDSVRYFSTFRTLQVPIGEKIYFFPFGMDTEGNEPSYYLQMEIEINPYTGQGDAVSE